MREHRASVTAPSYVPEQPAYRSYTLRDLGRIPQIRSLPRHLRQEMEVVAKVLPFRASNFVVDELIDWDEAPDDPYFRLVFPVRDMLREPHYDRMAAALQAGDETRIQTVAQALRGELNPHPAYQMEQNVPLLDGVALPGMQHKYPETVLFFPTQGQTCHAYCSFCFRWAQFVGDGNLRFASREAERLVAYLGEHPEVSDVLLTGGDPLVMKTRTLSTYLDALLATDLEHVSSIRIGTKSLTFWPYRFLTDPDADELLRQFERVVRRGKHLALMAHFNHPRAVTHPVVQRAIRRIRETGAEIRTQSPLLRHINDSPEVWSQMWSAQVKSGCIPYYMFVARDTGAQHHFGVPLERAWEIFQGAYSRVSGLARTVRGPCMSAAPGKVQVMGVSELEGERVFTLQFIQAREPDRVLRPFFARHDPDAYWFDDLRPAFGQESFFTPTH